MRLELDNLLLPLGAAARLFEDQPAVVVGYSTSRENPKDVRYVLQLDDGTIVHSVQQWVTKATTWK